MNKVLNFGGERIVVAQVPESEVWIPRLLKEMDTNRKNIGRSHKIRGRWENSYLKEDLVPTIRVPMRFARNLGKEELGVLSVILFKPLPFSSDQFPPFWFNLAQGGEETGLHDHVDQAILSCVVYLDCKEDSGNLFFRMKGEDDLDVLPEVGKMILFSPCLRHGVRQNRSESERISLAFNLFPFPLPAVDL